MKIKFRTYISGKFYYWGFIDGGFAGIASSSEESLNIDEYERRTQQYVGVTDKNGKDVYVGDFVELWHNKDKVRFIRDLESGLFWKTECVLDKDCNVIGNIYDNPELLKEEE